MASAVGTQTALDIMNESAIDKDRVAAYLFRPSPNGTDVIAMPVTDDEGIPEDSFGDMTGTVRPEFVIGQGAARRMTQDIDVLRAHAGCCGATRLDEGGCRVSMPTEGEYVLLSGSKYQQNHQHTQPLCDGLFAWRSRAASPEQLAVVELKGGRPDVGHAALQLQGGAELLGQLGASTAADRFTAVLVVRRLPTVAIRKLAKLSVRYKGRVVRIWIGIVWR